MLSSSSPITLAGSLNSAATTSAAMQQQSSTAFSVYGERPQMGLDVEYGTDPASGAIFKYEGRKHDDLKQMLDSNKDGLKLEAMKRIIGMIARGRDAGDLFPAVVKNVVSKNIEVKKLVYVYLVRYAEEQQDLALLSISTFQRALKDPNQLIRASSIRVLSSIRVSMIVPIVMLAIRDSSADMSPYVRKTAAHAIPKLYSLDPEQKEELISVIEKLLSDRTTLVVGSAVMAFEEVCPERVDLIHKNYRKLCNLLVDVDEWGQVIIINMLTRYARTQFVNPNADDMDEEEELAQNSKNKKFYEDDSDDSNSNTSDNEEEEHEKSQKNKQKSITSSPSSSYHVDLDHRLLLRQTKPLLQSRNASVVMAVAQLYHHIAPKPEVQLIAKPLIRFLRSHKEVQSVVLTCIASMSTERRTLFEPYTKSFFVRTSDSTHIKLLKLEILTNLAYIGQSFLILKEFQTYISSNDRTFVTATIQAIGRCAASVKGVTEKCLNGLVHLLSNRDEHVVAESVVVIKKLLQTDDAQHYVIKIISQMAKLLDFIKVPAARSAILWLIGEYNDKNIAAATNDSKKVPNIAPDVLRKLAKTFVDEEDAVKLQVLNLAVKLYLTNPQQTSLLCQYVFTLARYDVNYDIRDRARFLKQFIFPANGKSSILSEASMKIFLSAKPAPTLESKYHSRNNYQLGSLSHYLNMPCSGYQPLPVFPEQAPDPSVRNVEGFMHETRNNNAMGNHQSTTPQKQDKKPGKQKKTVENSFFSESEEKSSVYSNSSDSTSSSSSSSSSVSSDSEAETDQKPNKENTLDNTVKSNTSPPLNSTNNNNNNSKQNPLQNNVSANNSGTSDSESSSTYGGSSSSESDSDSADTGSSESEEEPSKNKKPIKSQKAVNNVEPAKANKSNLDLLLDLDDIPPIGPVMTPSLGGFLTPATPMTSGFMPQNIANRIELVGPSFICYDYKLLLNKLSGHGLQVSYRYTRSPHLYSSTMVSIELKFHNQTTSSEISNIQMGQKSLPPGMQMQEFAPINMLMPDQSATSILGVDFNDSTHAIEFEISSSNGNSRVAFKPIIGELVRSVDISETMFQEERLKLRGMNEHQVKLNVSRETFGVTALKQKIFECINVACITQNSQKDIHLFVGQTMTSKSLVLIMCDWSQTEDLMLQINCEKMVIGSMVLNEISQYLKSCFN